jgi:protein-disulfide isomerase
VKPTAASRVPPWGQGSRLREVAVLRTRTCGIWLALSLGVSLGVASGQETRRNSWPSSDVVATVGTTTILRSALDEAVGAKTAAMRAQIYRTESRVLRELVDRAVLESEAKRQGVSAELLLRREVEEKVPPVKPEEVRAVFEAARDKLPKTSESDALESIRTSMQQTRMQARRDEYLRQLRSGFEIQLSLPVPRQSVTVGHNPVLGDPSAPVTMVVFSDYACPFCAQLEDTLKRLRARFHGGLRIAFRDFPLPIHKQAVPAAHAAACAGEQGRYWEMHDKLFANQQNLGSDDFNSYAEGIGLDPRRFAECVQAGRHAVEIERDRVEGERVGVAGTPATFINGRLIPGAMPIDEYIAAIDDELQAVARVRSGIASPNADPLKPSKGPGKPE